MLLKADATVNVKGVTVSLPLSLVETIKNTISQSRRPHHNNDCKGLLLMLMNQNPYMNYADAKGLLLMLRGCSNINSASNSDSSGNSNSNSNNHRNDNQPL